MIGRMNSTETEHIVATFEVYIWEQLDWNGWTGRQMSRL